MITLQISNKMGVQLLKKLSLRQNEVWVYLRKKLEQATSDPNSITPFDYERDIESLRNLDDIIRIQSQDGTWDYDPYMHGMLNGLILAQQIIDPSTNREPVDPPKKWLYEENIGIRGLINKIKGIYVRRFKS